MKEYKFYKENQRWFIDLPDFSGEKDELEMVLGADVMLDVMSEGSSEVYMIVSMSNFQYANVLEITNDLNQGNKNIIEFDGGQYYLLKNYEGIEFNLNVWLCDVTKYVFKCFPEKIYFKKIEK